jgi:hypothetical protein
MKWKISAGEPSAEQLRRGLLGLALVTLLVSLVAALDYGQLPGISLWQDLQLAIVSAAMVGCLLLEGKRPRPMVCRVAFVIIVVSTLVTMTVNQQQLALSGYPLLPLVGHKAMLLTIGTVAPGLWLGAISIVAITVAAIVQATALPGEAFSGGEPLLTCLIAGVSTGLLVARLRARAVERALANSLAEARAAERLAATYVAIRDLANTPLQTLELSTKLLELREDVDAALVARMRRALDQLERLSEVLVAEEERHLPEPRRMAAFDPWRELALRLRPQS